MTQSGKSLFYFGIYVVLTGLVFLLIPETFISLAQLPSMPTGWTRVVGLLALVIGSYDILAGKNNIKLLIEASVYVRLGFALGTILLVVFGQMPVTLILLGSVDGLGAFWTTMALKSESSQ
jgi:uncharacterized protein YjeT (DUF2065 family)